MGDITCPYCDYDFELDHDDGAYYDQNNLEECVCPECDKTFLVSAYCSWSYDGLKADCLNGSPHAWSDWRKLWEGEGQHAGEVYERRYCDDCGKEETEWHKLDPTTKPVKEK